MPKISAEQAREREEGILNACRELYKTVSFNDVTLKDIGTLTPFTRTSIYNYFKTKEEILLALLKQEYGFWIADIQNAVADREMLSGEEFAAILASTLSKRGLLLKELSMNIYGIEENSSVEKLTEFKVEYKRALQTIKDCIAKIRPEISDRQADDFIYCFFPFIFGIYPYTSVTPKQDEAMKRVNLDYRKTTVYDLVYMCVKMLL